MKMCEGGCNQGRKPRPHPGLCEDWEPLDTTELLVFLLWPVVTVAVFAAVIAAWTLFSW